MSDQPGVRIGGGRATDILDLGGGRVLRRYRTDHDSAAEAALMELAAGAGMPVPRVHGASGREMVMDLIPGPTMSEWLARAPWRLWQAADTLAGLHLRLHAIPFEGARLVHMDLHPGNVIMSPSGPVLLDWANARAGAAEEDVAQTWLILEAAGAAGDVRGRDRVLLSLRNRFLKRFLGHFDQAAVVAVMSEVAAERVRDVNVTDSERAALARLLDRLSSSR